MSTLRRRTILGGALGTLAALQQSAPKEAQPAIAAAICLMGYVASFAISLGPIFWLLNALRKLGTRRSISSK